MRVIPVEKVKPGMIIDRTIIGLNGEVLLSRGVEIDEIYLKRLREIGVPLLYIKDEKIGSIEYDEVISEQTRLEASRVTQDVMSKIRLSSDFDLKRVKKVVDNLIMELVDSKELLVAMIDMRAASDSGFHHGVNTAVLSIITGIALGYDNNKLSQLACGALFHDVGLIKLPPEIINGMAQLSSENNELIRKHPELGFDILRNKEGVSLMSAHVALQHHEKYDGSGYPRGLSGDDIREMARIVSIAAIYDNIINTNRVLPFRAIEQMTLYSGKWFDPGILEVFIRSIAVFPIGTSVLLNSGDTAIVTKANKKFPSRPVVRVYKNLNGLEVNPPYEIDLESIDRYFIRQVLDFED